jgi:hypothetical protein
MRAEICCSCAFAALQQQQQQHQLFMQTMRSHAFTNLFYKLLQMHTPAV